MSGELIPVNFTDQKDPLRGRVKDVRDIQITVMQRRAQRLNKEYHEHDVQGVTLRNFRDTVKSLRAMHEVIREGNSLFLAGLIEEIKQVQDTFSEAQQQELKAALATDLGAIATQIESNNLAS